VSQRQSSKSIWSRDSVIAARDTDQPLGEVGADTPIAGRVGIGQSFARDVAAEPQVVELAGLRTAAKAPPWRESMVKSRPG